MDKLQTPKEIFALLGLANLLYCGWAYSGDLTYIL